MECSVNNVLPIVILVMVAAVSIYVAVRAIKNGKVGPEYGLSLKPRPKPKDRDSSDCESE
jgi:hypothetical protein